MANDMPVLYLELLITFQINNKMPDDTGTGTCYRYKLCKNKIAYRILPKSVPVLAIRIVDPDWIRIQCLCGSESAFGTRIPDPGH
jgi:hypothetical protein